MKNNPSSLWLFSQRVDCVTLNEVYRAVLAAARQEKTSFFFALNLHIFSLLARNTAVKKKHEHARIIFADGQSIVRLSAWMGRPLPARVSGTQLTEKILTTPKLRVFALGSTPPILQALQHRYPTVKGRFSPSFTARWSEKENAKILQRIRATRPTILLVGLGSLRQEMWLLENLTKTGVPVGIGVGSAFDILSGAKPRAPQFFHVLKAEWLWRLLLEPVRLFPRYLDDGLFLLAWLWKHRRDVAILKK